MGAIPEFAPAGENHLLRSSSVVTHVEYAKAAVSYKTFDLEATEVLRLKSRPTQISAGAAMLAIVEDPSKEGYSVTPLAGGDFVVRVHHRAAHEVKVAFAD
jgi:hypothetical protein